MSYLFQLPIYQTPHTATVMFNNELKECTESSLQPAGHTYAQTSMCACGKCPSEKYTQPNSLVKTFSSLFRLRSRVATHEKVKCYPERYSLPATIRPSDWCVELANRVHVLPTVCSPEGGGYFWGSAH